MEDQNTDLLPAGDESLQCNDFDLHPLAADTSGRSFAGRYNRVSNCGGGRKIGGPNNEDE
ncbi:MAG: hypothetical protein WC505_04665 [Patescibacteria group bacterium]